MAQSTTITSCANSTPIILDPKLKTTTVQVTVTSGAAGFGFVQYTLDDPTTTPAPTISWANISSAINSTAADSAGGVTYTMLSPIGGVRYSLLGSSVTVSGTLTLKTLQSVTG